MGEVYCARDGKLNRDVALKILPAAFVADPDRLSRFRREAQVLASLNHPNIAAIYGFEDSGATHALVLELVEGPTLADRIAEGPIPLVEAIAIAKQIAEALDAAHQQGIVHRDLKPANVTIRGDGAVKVPLKLTPVGSATPPRVMVMAAGKPLAVTRELSFCPTVNDVAVALVKTGAWFTVSVKACAGLEPAVLVAVNEIA